MDAAAALTTWEAQCCDQHLSWALSQALNDPARMRAVIPGDPRAMMFMSEWLREHKAVAKVEKVEIPPNAPGCVWTYKIERFIV